LLKLLALLENSGRQRDVALERAAAEGVKADMVIVLAGPARRRHAGEIEGPGDGAGPGIRRERRHRLDDARRITLVLDANDAAEGCDVDLVYGERGQHGAHHGRRDRRQVALDVADDILLALGVE